MVKGTVLSIISCFKITSVNSSLYWMKVALYSHDVDIFFFYCFLEKKMYDIDVTDDRVLLQSAIYNIEMKMGIKKYELSGYIYSV